MTLKLSGPSKIEAGKELFTLPVEAKKWRCGNAQGKDRDQVPRCFRQLVIVAQHNTKRDDLERPTKTNMKR